jgi:fucose permease
LVLLGIHGRESGRAISEANLMSYLGALLAPMAVWLFTNTVGWRAVAGIGWVVLMISMATLRGANLPSNPQGAAQPRSQLGRVYWTYWLLLTISVGVEFCFGVWSASFLERIGGFVREHAVIGSSLFPLGVLAGRIFGTLAIRRLGAWRLAFVSLCAAFCGFFVFWLSGPAWLTLVGLGVSGVGVANLYATSLTLALSAEPDEAAQAAARTSMASGSAIILTPLILGALADSVGLFAGYAIVPILVLMGMASLCLASRDLEPKRAPA